MENGRQPGPRIVDLHEREARVFPRGELFNSAGQSLVLPETRNLAAVDLRDVASGVELRAQGLIGYLPLTSSLILNLRPKFPVANFWGMLEAADGSYERVLPVLRAYESANVAAPHQILVKGFCFYLTQILDLGVSRGYYREEHGGYFLPKVNFSSTMAKYLSRGDDVSVVSDVFAFSANLRVNRILKAACVAFLRIMPRGAQWREERMLLADALNALHRLVPENMEVGEQVLAWALPAWVRDAYYGALTVYAVLLGHTKIGFSYAAQGCKMPSFLFSLDDIFERFVRNTFRRALAGDGINVLDGNNPNHQRPLFSDNKKFPVKPDLIFRKRRGILALGEVKYKPKLDEGDRYQLISHVVAMGAPVGVWISPAIDGDGGLEYVGAMANGALFYHYKMSIGGALDVSSIAMTQKIGRLIKSGASEESAGVLLQ